ncbi:MAG: LysR family transcriptional regulator [Desulfobacca sp.]|nr:LysR family transcriptional regulator [Desulfobacca sp.]
MEWQQLVGFYQVVRSGSFTKAAELTLRTQSALSQQVKALETELDCQLLERIGKRRLRLTPAGEKLFKFSQALLDNYDHLVEELNELKGRPQGQIRLAAPFTTLYHLIPPHLQEYIKRFPEVELTILDRSQPRVLELVKAGDVDFGLALESLVPPELVKLRWLQVATFLMTPLGHPLSRLKRVTLRQIAKYPLILPPPSPEATGRRRLEDLLRQRGLGYHIIMESSNVELSSLYVEMRLGISFATMVRDLSRPQPRQLAFIPLPQYFKPNYLALVMRKDKFLPPYQKAWIELLLSSSSGPEAP